MQALKMYRYWKENGGLSTVLLIANAKDDTVKTILHRATSSGLRDEQSVKK